MAQSFPLTVNRTKPLAILLKHMINQAMASNGQKVTRRLKNGLVIHMVGYSLERGHRIQLTLVRRDMEPSIDEWYTVLRYGWPEGYTYTPSKGTDSEGHHLTGILPVQLTLF